MSDTRDIESAYRAALLEEYASYRQGGRAAEAAHVARVLKAQYGIDVTPAEPQAAAPEPVVETAASEAPAEAAVPERAAPVRRGPGRPRKSDA